MSGRVRQMLKMKVFAFLHTLFSVISEFLLSFVYKGKGEPLPPISDLVLLESAQSLAAKIRARKLRSEDVVTAYIERIREVNPILNAMVHDRFAEAVQEAKAVDKLVASGEKTEAQLAEETPFLGVPFTIKDSFQCRGLRQTIGLVVRRDMVSTEDAPAVALMKKAGAVLLGVTNVSEVCMWWESHNKVYGRTNNPYDTTRCVGGSSGGEGCLIGGAGSVIGVGSDVGGSIRIPAFFNGIFGHKGSKGMVPNDGQLPRGEGEILNYLSTGPMCRYAQDLMPMFKVLSRGRASALQLDSPVDVRKLTFFYIEGVSMPMVSSVDSESKSAMRKVVTYLEKAYGIKAKKVDIQEFKYSGSIWTTKMSQDSTVPFSVLLKDGEGSLNPWLELLKWCCFSSNHTLPALMTCMFQSMSRADADHLSRVDAKCQLLLSRLQELLGDDGILLFPPLPRLAPYHNLPVFTAFDFHYTAIFNILGLPVTQCPLGLSADGLPLGVQVVGNLNCDRLTLAVALELERAFGGWVSPCAIP